MASRVTRTFTIEEVFTDDPQQHRRAIDRVREILLSVIVLIPEPNESILDKNGGGTNGRHA